MKFISQRFIAILSLIVISTSAYAFNFSFLNNSPASNLTKQDWEIISSTGTRVLDQARDGTKVTWKNPNTGAFGYFIPSATTRQRGMVCRKLTLFENARGYTNQSTYRFCKLNGEWKTA